MPREKSISRGDFLKVVGAAGMAGSTLSILACQPNTNPQQSGGGGGSGPEEKALNFYNWTGYVAKSTIPNFEKQTGIKVTQDYYTSNEELLAKLQAGGTGYDVIVPSDYMVGVMIKSEIGELGESWDPMWDPEFKGKIGMLNDVRETTGAALYRLGYSVNTTDPDQLDEAEAALKEQKPLLRGYFDSYSGNRPLVLNGDLLLGHNFSGDAYDALSRDPDLDYVIPKP